MRNVQDVSNKLDAFMTLRFTATGEPSAAKLTPIFPMTQYADNIWSEGKILPLFTSQVVLKMLSLYTYTFLAPAGEIVNYLLKMLCTNI
jgi:hypothetical protein